MNDDFFRKRKKSKIAFSEQKSYDLKNFENDLEACGIIDIEGFQARHKELFSELILDSDKENPVAVLSKRIEEHFSPREVAFLMAKDLLLTAYNDSVEQLKQKEE